MRFGLMNVPSNFQRMMDAIFWTVMSVMTYIDDIMVFFFSLEEHIEHVLDIFRNITKANLKLNVKNCFFSKHIIELLGHVVDGSGI